MESSRRTTLYSFPLLAVLLLLTINTANASTVTRYCPHSSTSQCAIWLSNQSGAWNEANIRYWQYNGFVNPYGVLDLELKVLPSNNKVHVFKDNRTEQNIFDSNIIRSYTKTTTHAYYDTVRARIEFLLHAHNYVYHVMMIAESRVSKSGVWESSKNCIVVDGISKCKKIKNDAYSPW